MNFEEPNSDHLLHLFDEINESESRLPTDDFYRHLIKWGLPQERAKRYIEMFDPKRTGFVKREDVCKALNCYPNESEYLRDVEVLTTDMSQHKRESVIKIVLDAFTSSKIKKKDRLNLIKAKLDKLYGRGWNVYMAEGRYWAVCSHKPGSNLTFVYRGVVYGVFQTPTETELDDYRSKSHETDNRYRD